MATFDPRNLPEDPKLVREIAVAALQALQESERQKQALIAYAQELRVRLFGRKSEVVDDKTQQLLSFIQGNLAIRPEPAPKPPEPPAAPKKGHGRARLPANLIRNTILHDVPKKDRRCRECRKELVEIGREATERVEYVPASVHVIRDVRLRYG